jgi:hypothetical protein
LICFFGSGLGAGPVTTALGHEDQFDLDTDAGQLFLDRLLTFLRQRLAAPPQSPGTDRTHRPGTAP